MATDIQLTLDLQKEDWAEVLNALDAASKTERDPLKQVRVQAAYNLISNAMRQSASERLLGSPMEVRSTVPIQVKMVAGDWPSTNDITPDLG